MGAFTLGAQYAYNRWNDVYGSTYDAKGHDFVLEGKYALSKRTDLYARVGRYNAFKVNAGAATYKTQSDVGVVGVRHRF
jgi:predicted porin